MLTWVWVDGADQPWPDHVMLLLTFGRWILRENPLTVDELDGSHQSRELPSILREIWEEARGVEQNQNLRRAKKKKRTRLNTLLVPAPCS